MMNEVKNSDVREIAEEKNMSRLKEKRVTEIDEERGGWMQKGYGRDEIEEGRGCLRRQEIKRKKRGDREKRQRSSIYDCTVKFIKCSMNTLKLTSSVKIACPPCDELSSDLCETDGFNILNKNLASDLC